MHVHFGTITYFPLFDEYKFLAVISASMLGEGRGIGIIEHWKNESETTFVLGRGLSVCQEQPYNLGTVLQSHMFQTHSTLRICGRGSFFYF